MDKKCRAKRGEKAEGDKCWSNCGGHEKKERQEKNLSHVNVNVEKQM